MVLAFVKKAKDFLELKYTNKEIVDYREPNLRNIMKGSKEDIVLKFKNWLDTQESKAIEVESMYINDKLLSEYELRYPNWKDAYHLDYGKEDLAADIISKETGLKILYCGNGDDIDLKYAFLGKALFNNSKKNIVNTGDTKPIILNIQDFINEYDKKYLKDFKFGLVSHSGSARENYFNVSIGFIEPRKRDVEKSKNLAIAEKSDIFCGNSWGVPVYGINIKESDRYFTEFSKDSVLEKYQECKTLFNNIGIDIEPKLIISMTNEDV